MGKPSHRTNRQKRHPIDRQNPLRVEKDPREVKGRLILNRQTDKASDTRLEGHKIAHAESRHIVNQRCCRVRATHPIRQISGHFNSIRDLLHGLFVHCELEIIEP